MRAMTVWFFAVLTFLGVGCGSDETHFLRCGRGISVEVNRATYCAYSAELVAELGDDFACPEGTKARVELEGAVVCSPLAEASDADHLPAQVCATIDRRCGGAVNEDIGLRNALCDAQCERAVRCYPESPAYYEQACGPALDECKQELVGANIYRTSFLRAYVECLETMCVSDDSCADIALDEVLPGWRDDELFVSCGQRYEDCGREGNPFDDALCDVFVMVIDRERDRLEACLTLACDEVSSCVEEGR